jgi:hypothetical protein
MARGFESKSVADQQESASAPSASREEPSLDPARLARKRRLDLARAEAHRQMLERALRALDEEIASLQ